MAKEEVQEKTSKIEKFEEKNSDLEWLTRGLLPNNKNCVPDGDYLGEQLKINLSREKDFVVYAAYSQEKKIYEFAIYTEKK